MTDKIGSKGREDLSNTSTASAGGKSMRKMSSGKFDGQSVTKPDGGTGTPGARSVRLRSSSLGSSDALSTSAPSHEPFAEAMSNSFTTLPPDEDAISLPPEDNAISVSAPASAGSSSLTASSAPDAAPIETTSAAGNAPAPRNLGPGVADPTGRTATGHMQRVRLPADPNKLQEAPADPNKPHAGRLLSSDVVALAVARGESLEGADLSDIALSNLKFSASNCLRNANLNGTRFLNCSFNHVDFSGAEIKDTEMVCGRIKNCNFSNSIISVDKKTFFLARVDLSSLKSAVSSGFEYPSSLQLFDVRHPTHTILSISKIPTAYKWRKYVNDKSMNSSAPNTNWSDRVAIKVSSIIAPYVDRSYKRRQDSHANDRPANPT